MIKIPIHGIDSKGLGFVFFYFLFFLSLLFSFLKIFLESPLLSFYFTTTF